MSVVSLLLITLATARLTRLVTSDVLTQPPREWLVRWLTAREGVFWNKLAYLLVCDWCASVYVGGAVAGAWYAWGENIAFMTVTAALSASYAAGFLATKAGD